MGLQGEGSVGVPAYGIVYKDVAVAVGNAACACASCARARAALARAASLDGNAVATQGCAQCCTCDVAACCSNGDVFGVYQPSACFATIGLGADAGAVCYIDLCAAGFDKAAIGACMCAFSGDAAADFGFAVLHVCQQNNFAFFVEGSGVGFNAAAVFDECVAECIPRFGGEVNFAAFCRNDAAVGDLCLYCACIYGDAVELALWGEGDLAACCEGYLPAVGGDVALVFYGWGYQGDDAAVGAELAVVFDFAAGIAASKAVVACHEVGITHVQCACYQAASIDLCAFAKEYAVGVENKYLAVGA